MNFLFVVLIGVISAVCLRWVHSRLELLDWFKAERIELNDRLRERDDEMKALKHELYCVRQHLPSDIRHLDYKELDRI